MCIHRQKRSAAGAADLFSPVGTHFLALSCSLYPRTQLQLLIRPSMLSVQSWSQPPLSTEQLVAVIAEKQQKAWFTFKHVLVQVSLLLCDWQKQLQEIKQQLSGRLFSVYISHIHIFLSRKNFKVRISGWTMIRCSRRLLCPPECRWTWRVQIFKFHSVIHTEKKRNILF